ncbi:MAG: helix-hairpin-helix domain-containing protein [Oscillospiraceae bacterium]|nr:helix-hairpin-helix domain-containing protein [Oscillospiraceae bacterium]
MKKDPVFWMTVTAAVMTVLMICSNLFLRPEFSAPVMEYVVSSSAAAAEKSHVRSDINLATAYDLEQVEGIGEVTAQKILRYVEEYGPLTDMKQLLEVNGIGETKLERLKYYFFAGREE